MQQYRYLKYSTTFIMFCLLVHGIFMYLIVTYVIYFKQYFLLMVPNSTFFWNSNICVLFLQLMMIILNWAHPTTEEGSVVVFIFMVAGSHDKGVKHYQLLVTEMPVFSFFERQFWIWHLSVSCCCHACSRYTETQRRGTVGNVHLLFIYKLAVPHHVKLTPLMGSCLSCLKDGLSPAKATYQLPGSVAACLHWAACFTESTC